MGIAIDYNIMTLDETKVSMQQKQSSLSSFDRTPEQLIQSDNTRNN